MPGRGGGGWAWPGAGRVCCCCKRATRSGRGGTTGRAAGWPASVGRAEDRSGREGGAPGVGEIGSDGGAAARAIGCGATGPGVGGGGGGVDAGIGCRGPERIWPGRGAAGTGLAGTALLRNGGWIGALTPLDKGGRNGAGLLRGSSVVTAATSLAGAEGVSPAGDGVPLAAMADGSGA
jgi:hypothetical protein